MLSGLYKYMNTIHPLSDEIIQEFERCFEYVEVPKAQSLLRDSEICNYTYVITNGLVRMYYQKDGQEISSMFIEEDTPFNAPDSYYSRTPGYLCLDALEPTRLARIHYNQLQSMYLKFPELNFVGRVITEKYFVKSEERLYLLRKQTGEERYSYFLTHYPELIQRVPLKYIASYLGLSFETLSRIRNKIRK